MSCFTVNKLLGAVSGKNKSTPSPKRKQQKPTTKPLSANDAQQQQQQQQQQQSNSPRFPRVQIVQEDRRQAALSSSSPTPHQQMMHFPLSQPPQGNFGPALSSSSACSSPARNLSPMVQRRRQQSPLPPIPVATQQAQIISSLQMEVEDMNFRMMKLSSDRDYLESTLSRMQLDRIRLLKERDDQLESQSVRYEERLVELHSVIAELTRQLDEKAREKIQEEEEEDEDDVTTREDCDKRDAVKECEMASEMHSRTSTDILDAEAVEAGNRLMLTQLTGKEEEEEVTLFPINGGKPGRGGRQHQPSYPDLSFLRLADGDDGDRLSVSPSDVDDVVSGGSSFAALALQQELADVKERNLRLQARLQRKEAQLAEAGRALEAAVREKEEKEVVGSKRVMSPKRARKVGRRAGCDVASNDRMEKNAVVAEQLSMSVREESSLQEIENTTAKIDTAEKARIMFEEKLKEFELEMERLKSRIEHLRSQNDVLSLTLAESKSTCENLTVAIGKYESNHTAQQLAAGYADSIIEALEMLAALARIDGESKSGGRKRRAKAEMNAARLLKRLESDAANRPDSGLSLPSAEVDDRGFKLEEDSSGYSHDTNSSTESASSGVLGKKRADDSLVSGESDLETRLASIVDCLKRWRSSVRATVSLDMEGVHMERAREEEAATLHTDEDKETLARAAKNAELEMAVIIQELMCLREERCEMRARLFELDGERTALSTALVAEKSKTAILAQKQQVGKDDTGDDQARLLFHLEETRKDSETRLHEQDQVINELRKTNKSLSENLDRTRRRYQGRLKRLEQQILQSILKKQLGKTFALDSNSQSVYSCLSTETERSE